MENLQKISDLSLEYAKVNAEYLQFMEQVKTDKSPDIRFITLFNELDKLYTIALNEEHPVLQNMLCDTLIAKIKLFSFEQDRSEINDIYMNFNDDEDEDDYDEQYIINAMFEKNDSLINALKLEYENIEKVRPKLEAWYLNKVLNKTVEVSGNGNVGPHKI